MDMGEYRCWEVWVSLAGALICEQTVLANQKKENIA